MTAADVAGNLAYQIRSYDWATFANSSVSVMAPWTGGTSLTLIFGRTGKVKVTGAQMDW